MNVSESFLLSAGFTVSDKVLYFHYHSVVYISLENSSFTCGRFRSTFGDFVSFLIVWRFFCCFSVIDLYFELSVAREHTVHEYDSFNFAKVCSVTQDKVHCGKCAK